MTNTFPEDQALCARARALAKAGDIDGAKATAEKIALTTLKFGALHAIARRQVEAGDTQEARETLAQAREIADDIPHDGIDGGLRSGYAFWLLADMQAQAGDITAALATAENNPNPISRDMSFRDLAIRLAQNEAMGSVATAIAAAITEKIDSPAKKSQALTAIGTRHT